MIKRGWLQDGDASMLESQMDRFFDGNIPHLAAKKTSYYDEIQPVQLAWLFRVKQIAESLAVPRYSEKSLQDALPHLRQLLSEPEEVRHVPRILSECGVRFTVVEGLPAGKIDGVCLWIDSSSPVIGLSLRHDRIDNFWFVLRHEIEHILRKDGQPRRGHNGGPPILDDLDGDNASTTNEKLPLPERIANSAAAEFSLPKEEIESFILRKSPYFSERDIVGFARRLQVHPGIVVGQIQNRTGRWELLRKYLVKVRQFVIPSAVADGWGQVAPVSI